MNNDMYITDLHNDVRQLNYNNNTITISIIIVYTIDSNFSITYGKKLPNKLSLNSKL